MPKGGGFHGCILRGGKTAFAAGGGRTGGAGAGRGHRSDGNTPALPAAGGASDKERHPVPYQKRPCKNVPRLRFFHHFLCRDTGLFLCRVRLFRSQRAACADKRLCSAGWRAPRGGVRHSRAEQRGRNYQRTAHHVAEYPCGARSARCLPQRGGRPFA